MAKTKKPSRERTRVLKILASVFAGLVIALLYWRSDRIVSWAWIGGAGAVWGGGGIALRTHTNTWGRERHYLDWWSVPHFLGGVLLAMFGIGLVWVAALATAWECVELASRVDEYPTNRVCDIALAVGGWALVNALVGGGFPLT
jgi:hypothetical protein